MSKRITPPSNLALLAFAVAMASICGCGAGTAAAVSGGGGGGGSGNAPPSLSGLSVLDPKRPDLARVRFVLADLESNPADVELFFQLPGQAREPITQIDYNPATLSTSSDGVEHALPWNFAAEPALPDDGSFVEGVRVIAALGNGQQEIVLGANDDFGLGNDPPEVHDPLPPAPEVDGVVPLRFAVSDSSNDIVSIEVQFDIIGDEPDLGWRFARPGGLLPNEPTPELAFPGVEAPEESADLVFFWDTDADLTELERDVRVRFTARDEVVPGVTVETPVFRVDNNAEPIATVHGDLLLLDPDERGGIPIPYTVRDEESDEVEVVFQWRHPDESFPPLPDTPAEILAVLADPIQRQALHVCSEYPTWVEGRVVPIDATSVRLPEIATTASSILAQGIVGREIEILRPPNVLTPMASKWASNPLDHPVAALPIRDGIEAVVLDRAGSGSWRVRQIDLATGIVTRELVDSAPGEPDAMCLASDEQSVLVAADIAGVWQVSQVDLASGATTLVISDPGTTESGQIRGIAALGSHAALITVASSLVRIDWSASANPTAVTILDGLATPCGVVVDPLDATRIYLAERDAETESGVGQILSIKLDTLEALPIVAKPVALLDDVFARAFNRPGSLALDRSGSRLMAITQRDPFEPSRQLEAIDLRGAGENHAFQIGSNLSSPIDPVVGEALATGSNGVIVVALTSQNDFAVAGGVEQRRTIGDFEQARKIAHVTQPFAPTISSLQGFRIAAPQAVSKANASGARGVFVWNSADAPHGGTVLVRATPMDAEKGLAGATEGAKRIRKAIDTDPVVVGGPGVTDGPTCVVSADLDGDGDLDLVSANKGSYTLTVFFQTSPGVFGSTPLSLGNGGVTNNPSSVAPADLDGDGDLDLVSANAGSNTLTVFFQESPGVFGSTPLSLGNASVTNSPYSVAPADLDGDGDLDLVSANAGSNTLTVFFQESPGVFGSTPLSLGNAGVTSSPSSVPPADLDGDGNLDLVSANAGSNTLTVFFQESPGVFGSTPLSLGNASVTNSPYSVAPADLDGDGDLDLVSANYVSDTLTVFFQTSPGVFGSTPLSLGNASVTSGPYSVALADLDGDGDLDLVSANLGSNTLTVFFQESPGVFGSTPLSLGNAGVTNNPSSVAPADLDGDGDLDLVSANAGSNTLTVFFQESPGVFGSTPLSLGNASVTNSPSSVAPADLDGDGDLDLVSANAFSHTLTVFFQESPGVFGSTPLSLGNGSVTNTPSSIAPADLDGDGDLDLVSANANSNTLTVFFQTSPGVFGSTPLSLGNASVTSGPNSVAPADLDGDGDLDLVSTNGGSNTLTIFWNNH